MILQLLFQIIFLPWTVNGLNLKTNCTSRFGNDTNSFLYEIKAHPYTGNWSDELFINNNSEAFELLPRREQKKPYYGVKYCEARIPWSLTPFNASIFSVSDEGDGVQQCPYTIFEGHNHREMTQDIVVFEKFYQEKAHLRLDPGQEQTRYYGVKYFQVRIPWTLKTVNVSGGGISDEEDGGQDFSIREVWQSFSLDTPVFVKIFNFSTPYYKKRDRLRQQTGIDNDEYEFPKASVSRSKSSYASIEHFSDLFSLFLLLAIACLGNVLLLAAKRWLSMIMKKIKDLRLHDKFFEQNGGLLIQQLLHSYDGNVDKSCKLFNSKDLDKATDHFNERRVLGQGGQGTVYKGMLEDGRIIAVKKCKVVDERKLKEFINEIVILSQINHRNVVKLIGCCLETEVPLLVYEFIPNGTLFQYLHDENEEFLLMWDMRLRIAIEVASALSYLHWGASFPIFHRDIKSANVLLDVNYRAKVADFGTSLSTVVDQTHVSTIVQGSLGYLDPEYFQSNRFTDKSDVYSFGVVLIELLTGLKPIFSTTTQENINLAKYFILTLKSNRLHDILATQVKQQGKKDEIAAFANLAKRCLSQNGKQRPTMKEVMIVLEGIRASKKKKVPFKTMLEGLRALKRWYK